jgi:peptidoglycan/xylan/chitin deacetylase (PgdA/CDA1 family)
MTQFFLAINYHYIGDADRYPFPGIIGVSTSDFETQVDELGRYFEFVGAEDIKLSISGVRSLPSKAAVITFDDGLREQYTEAVPILERRGIPFICFVSSAPLAEHTPCLIHKIHYLRSVLSSDDFLYRACSVADSEVSRLIAEIDNQTIPPNYYPYDEPRDRAVKYLINFVLAENVAKGIVEKLFEEHYGDEEFCRWFYLRAEDLRGLPESLGAVGVHGHRHISLASLSEAGARREIRQCVEILENTVGNRPFCISYPYGYREAVSLLVGDLAKEHGMRFGFTMEMCFNRNVSLQPHLLGRINNNEAPGHFQAAFSCSGEDLIVHDPNRMRLHRNWFVNDLTNGPIGDINSER